MTDVDALVAAWREWDLSPRSEPQTLVKERAIAALVLNGDRLHDDVASLRRSGVSLEDAVRRAATEQGVAA